MKLDKAVYSQYSTFQTMEATEFQFQVQYFSHFLPTTCKSCIFCIKKTKMII